MQIGVWVRAAGCASKGGGARLQVLAGNVGCIVWLQPSPRSLTGSRRGRTSIMLGSLTSACAGGGEWDWGRTHQRGGGARPGCARCRRCIPKYGLQGSRAPAAARPKAVRPCCGVLAPKDIHKRAPGRHHAACCTGPRCCTPHACALRAGKLRRVRHHNNTNTPPASGPSLATN